MRSFRPVRSCRSSVRSVVLFDRSYFRSFLRSFLLSLPSFLPSVPSFLQPRPEGKKGVLSPTQAQPKFIPNLTRQRCSQPQPRGPSRPVPSRSTSTRLDSAPLHSTPRHAMPCYAIRNAQSQSQPHSQTARMSKSKRSRFAEDTLDLANTKFHSHSIPIPYHSIPFKLIQAQLANPTRTALHSTPLPQQQKELIAKETLLVSLRFRVLTLQHRTKQGGITTTTTEGITARHAHKRELGERKIENDTT